MSRFDAQGHLLPELYTKTGHVENHFSVGPAILWAPVLVTVHVAVLLLDRFGAHIAANGYSHPYVLAMGLTTAFYGFLSLFLAFRIARKYFQQQWAFLATIGIWLASSLPVYMYFNPSWSHAFPRFRFPCSFVLGSHQVATDRGAVGVFGVFAGLMGNVYYPNAILLIFPALELAYQLRAARREPDRSPASARKCCCIPLYLYLLSWHRSCPLSSPGSLFMEASLKRDTPAIWKWNWNSPAFLRVLFSADHGLLSWTPILALAIIGLLFLVKEDSLLGTGAILAFLAYYVFISSYPDWDGMSSFGNRFFISLTPVFVLGLPLCSTHFPSGWEKHRGPWPVQHWRLRCSRYGISRLFFNGGRTWFPRVEKFPGRKWPTISFSVCPFI